MLSQPIPEWNEKLNELIKFFIETTPPKILGRWMRSFFLLNVSELKTVPQDWEEKVLRFIAILELIDTAEDERLNN
jgi:geranylgeranyl pyrophosphate synthase